MKFKTIKSIMVVSVLMALISSPANCGNPDKGVISARIIVGESILHPGQPIDECILTAAKGFRIITDGSPLSLRLQAQKWLRSNGRKLPPLEVVVAHYLTLYAKNQDTTEVMGVLLDAIEAGVLPEDFTGGFAEAAKAIFKSTYKISIAQGYLYAFDHHGDVYERDVPPLELMFDLIKRVVLPGFKGNLEKAYDAILPSVSEELLEDAPAAPSPIRMPFQPPVAAPPPPVRRVVEDTRLLTIEDLEMEFGLDLSSPPTESYMESPATPESRGEQPAVVSDEMQGKFLDLLIQWQDATTANNTDKANLLASLLTAFELDNLKEGVDFDVMGDFDDQKLLKKMGIQ